jgi:hypothetical protein
MGEGRSIPEPKIGRDYAATASSRFDRDGYSFAHQVSFTILHWPLALLVSDTSYAAIATCSLPGGTPHFRSQRAELALDSLITDLPS